MNSPSEMELMIPTSSPVSRAFTSYLSLYINNISIYKLKESTSYFPYINNYLLNINYYLEIPPQDLTVDLTANQPIIPLKNVSLHKLSKSIRKCPIPPNATAIWGY